MFTRRAAMIGAAAAALMLAVARLRRRPQAAAPEGQAGRAALRPSRTNRPPRQGPKIIEFKMTIEEKEIVIDEEGTKIQAMTFNGSMPGPMMVVHEGDYVELTLVNPDDQHDAAQHRLPRRDRRAGRRRADAGQPRRTGRAALEGDAHRRVRLSLRAGRPDDPLACRVGHERRRDGAAARRAEGRRGQAAALRHGSTTSARRTSTSRATRRASTSATTCAGEGYRRHARGDAQADPDPCRVQRQGRRADRQECADRQGRRDRADRPFARPTATAARI